MNSRQLILCLLACAAVAAAQDNPISAFNRRSHGQVTSWLIRSAERMPEENYAFKPTPDVRSSGQLVGHTADAQYRFCAPVLGEPDPARRVEQTKTAKADLIAALKEATAYCDRAYAALTDASIGQQVKFMNSDMAKITVLHINTTHLAEHYGNIVTYLRLKNVVPPSSEPGGPPSPKKQ
jgi:uncharacterized damage-inducible protein DinB